jgi:hypothetical protein
LGVFAADEIRISLGRIRRPQVKRQKNDRTECVSTAFRRRPRSVAGSSVEHGYDIPCGMVWFIMIGEKNGNNYWVRGHFLSAEGVLVMTNSKHAVSGLAVLGAVVALFFAVNTTAVAAGVRILEAPGGGQPAAARSDAEGTVHLLLHSAAGPQYVRSTDNGKTYSQPIAVVDQRLQKPGLEFTVWDMAVGQGGRVHVALGTNGWKLKLPQEEWAFHYTRLDPGAPAFSPVQNLNHKPSEGFSLAADDKGNVTACWLSGKLYANVSNDSGKTFAPAVEIDPAFNPCDCCTTSAAYGVDGKLAVLYREETNNDRDMFLISWDQERKQVSRTRVSTTLWKIDGCPMSYYTVWSTPDGYLAVWPTQGQIYFARLDSQGTLRSPVEIKTPGTTGMRTGMLALTDADGNTLVAWKKNGELGWQLYDQQGRPTGVPGSCRSAGNGVAGVLTKDGQFILFR